MHTHNLIFLTELRKKCLSIKTPFHYRRISISLSGPLYQSLGSQVDQEVMGSIMKKSLFKYIENFTTKK